MASIIQTWHTCDAFARQETAGGYLDPGYAQSFAEFGVPRELPECGGWILERPIPGSGYRDGMGCYPIFACRDWSRIENDLESLNGDLVSISLVTDPFGDYDIDTLRNCFDFVAPFKEHFVADLSQPVEEFISGRHRRRARKVMREVSVELCTDPCDCAGEWVKLYAELIRRHKIEGMKAFSHAAFARQLQLPGSVMFRATYRGVGVGAQLWFVQGDVGYCHLSAASELGYELEAAYAMFWFAYQYFSGKLRWLHIGGGAGVDGEGSAGLVQFKRGWATGTRTAYFCGRILDTGKYSEIVGARNISSTSYFPAYREGEFA